MRIYDDEYFFFNQRQFFFIRIDIRRTNSELVVILPLFFGAKNAWFEDSNNQSILNFYGLSGSSILLATSLYMLIET